MYTFRYVMPISANTIFKATGGAGRLYVHSVNILLGSDDPGVNKLLDITGSLTSSGFFPF